MPEHVFDPESVRDLGGAPWLVERRVAAAQRLADLALPTSDEEIWRYSRIDEFDPRAFRPVPGPGGSSAGVELVDAVHAIVDPLGARAGLVVMHNGRVADLELDDSLAAKGVVLADVAALDSAPGALGVAADASPDWFTTLNDALLTGGALIRVPEGVVVEHPIIVVQRADEPDGAVAGRVVVEAGAGSEATVVEHRSSPDAPLLSVPVAEAVVGDGAVLRYLSVQVHGAQAWEVALQRAHVGRDARLTSGAVALGGLYGRLRSEAFAVGEGGSSDLLAVYFADGDQMLDFRTLQDHDAPHSSSELLFKGAVEHRAHSVYSGLIRLRKDAKKAGAHQTNRTLKLSPESHAESVPNLEILANDVQCTHASAIGPVDDDQLHYLESRGVPPEVAERLVVFGFFEDVFERLPLGSLVEPLRDAVREKFERRDALDAEEGGRRG